MRVLLIGAYGFIGSAIARRLIASGHDVTAFGRSASTGRRLFPDLMWIEGDLNRMTRPDDWLLHLDTIDAVVNASGALQSGGGERLSAIQGDSIVALIAACERRGVGRFVQISAPGATRADESAFLSTKAVADERLRASPIGWAILRPGLVIGRNAYGGTLLIRALASMPLFNLTVHGRARIQTVALDDVSEAVVRCLAADDRIDIDLVERDSHSLAELIKQHRRWLGNKPPMAEFDFPPIFGTAAGFVADALGRLRWRSPLRSTAMAMITRGVTGDTAGGEALLGRPLLTLEQTLARNPSGLQDRWQGRLVLLTPFIIGSLSVLFILSGIVGLARAETVAAQLDNTAAKGIAGLLGMAGSVADIALGLAILVRPWARFAVFGMALLTAAYLLMGSWLRPDLWIDPFAPLAKAVSVMVLALVAAALLEER